jgi:ABC-type amino acid transport substrate-binding protein
VCHASQDREIAESAVVALEARGFQCWIAPRNVPPGTDYANAILSGISGSKLLLLIFSHRANQSPHVPREVERAVHRGMPIIPFRLDDVEPSGPLEYFISGAQWLDATTGPPEDQFPTLIEAIGALVAPTAPPTAPATEEEFSPEAREQLVSMVFRFGTDLARDPRRLQAVLRDMIGDHPAEISALVAAAEEGVPDALLESSDPGSSAAMERLTRRLKERRALAAKAAEWAVESWARALRIPPPPDLAETRPVSDASSDETRPVEAGAGLTSTVAAGQPGAQGLAEPPGRQAAGGQPAPPTPTPRRPPQRPPTRSRRPPWLYVVAGSIGFLLIVGVLANLIGDGADGPVATAGPTTLDPETTTPTTAGATTTAATARTTVAPRELSADSDEIVARGRVRIGVQANPFQPYSSFESDLTQEIVSRLFGAIDVEFVPLTAVERFTALETADIDLLIRNTTHTTSREALALFTSPYFLDGLAFAVRGDLGVSSIDGLAGRTVGVFAGTSTEADVRAALEGNGTTIIPVDDSGILQDLLEAGDVDAIAVFWTQALTYVETLGADVFLYDPSEPFAIAVPLGQPGLRDDLDRVLTEIVDDGTWRELYQRRFRDPPPWTEDEMRSFPPVDR